MTCPKLKIPWPRWAIGDKPNAEQEHENYLALERWADGILKCIPAAGADSWGTFTMTESISFSSPNVISTATDWELEHGTTGYEAYTGFLDPSFYVTCPPGCYQWTLELWGSDNWDGIINYTTDPGDGNVCGVIHSEVYGVNAGVAFNKREYYDEPVFLGISGGALVRSGTTSTEWGMVYIEFGLRPAPGLTPDAANGTIEAHLTLVRFGDAPATSAPS